MANCCDMQPGDIFRCESCGLKLKVVNACACKPGAEDACNVPLTCCGQEMKKSA